MRIVLIGADNEENLGVAMIAACLVAARHNVKVVAFSHWGELQEAIHLTLEHRPELVGLAMQFQHRGWEFTALAEQLRHAGFRGHLAAGGLFATAAHEWLLRDVAGIDSVVLHDGEETIVELADALKRQQSLMDVPGLAVRLDDGCVKRTPFRRNPQDLDALPLPKRYRPASRHFGVPFVPISGGRGCWGNCAFCSITSLNRSARKDAGGLGLRLRSTESIAREMAALTHREQTPCVFCFHDETLLLPRPQDTKKRLGELTEKLGELGVEGYGIVGKCRPDSLTHELAKDLAQKNVIRLYVGIENASQAGQDHLSRRTRTEQLDCALSAINDAGIFGCYNLLIFEPQTTLSDVRENIEFIRKHPHNPVNFCRAEPYHGTPLWERLCATGKLEGSWLGWDYHLEDPVVETLFRITAVAFRQRNFDAAGAANRSMSLGHMAKLLGHFYPTPTSGAARLEARARELTALITADTANLLEDAIKIVEQFDINDRDQIERQTVLLGLRVAESDAKLHALFDQFADDAEAYANAMRKARKSRLPARLYEAFTSMALASCLVAASPGCGGETDDNHQDPNPGDPPVPAGGRVSATGGSGGFAAVDPLPATGGRTAQSQTMGRGGVLVLDPPPPTGGRSSTTSSGRGGMMVVDPPPPTGGRSSITSSGRGGMIAFDPPPPTGGRSATQSSNFAGQMMGDPLVNAGGIGRRALDRAVPLTDSVRESADNEIRVGHFSDTRTRRTIRSRELPLFDPPDVTLVPKQRKNGVEISLTGVDGSVTTRWQSRGKISGEGLVIQWTPEDADDQLCVAVRTEGGVAVAALRAKDLPEQG